MNYIIIGVTCIVSFIAFSNKRLYDAFILWPYKMKREPAQYFRLITSGLLHADFLHLFLNMFTLYFFGAFLESALGRNNYLLFYILALIFADISTMVKYKDNIYYRSLGASGAVSAVLFATIYLTPWNSIYLFGAIPIPAILFAVIYVIYSIRMSRIQSDNINHSAHLYGALFGFTYMLIVQDPTHGLEFIERFRNVRIF